MNKFKSVVIRSAENNIHNKQLRKRVEYSLSADFEYIPREIVVLIIVNGKYYLKSKKGDYVDDKTKVNVDALIYNNIYYAYILEKQKNKSITFKKKEDVKDKNKYKNKNAIALIPKKWIEDGTIVLDKKV